MTTSVRSARRLSRIAVPLALGAALAVHLACGSSAPSGGSVAEAPAPSVQAANEEITLSPEAQRASGITVAAVTLESRAGDFETPAVLHVNETRTSRIGSLVDGVVTATDVQVGQRVARGSRLASIHSHAVHDAWADYRNANASRQRAAAELAYATSAEARASRLLAAKAVSLQEMERAGTDRAAAEQALAIAESELRRSLEELEHLGIDAAGASAAQPQETVPIVAPLGGVVLERLVTSGTAVTVGMPLYVVSDLSTLWAVAEVDEVRLPLLAAGRSAEIAVAAYPDRSFPAKVVAIGDSVNPETRRVTARLEVDNRARLLKPQMFATVRLSTAEAVPVAVAPAGAVQQFEEQPAIFVETTPGTFRRQAVVLGDTRDGRVELRGVAPGTRIAVTGTFLLKSKLLESEQPE